jgi:hypothetical protein
MRKYRALRFFVGLFRIWGVILIVIGVLPVLGFLPMLTSGPLRGAPGSFGASLLIEIVWFISSLLSGLVVIAFGELIQLFIDIEANTRGLLANPVKV